jgi:membrane fusion protein, multidrug efflux system
VRIRREGEGTAALVVPEKALISVQGSYSLAVVGPDKKVSLKRVETGPSVRGFRIITSGVNEGDSIVVEGVQKASDGALVNPQPAPPPATAASTIPAQGGASTSTPAPGAAGAPGAAASAAPAAGMGSAASARP